MFSPCYLEGHMPRTLIQMTKNVCLNFLLISYTLHSHVCFRGQLKDSLKRQSWRDLKPENILLPSTIDPEKDPKKLAVPLIPSSNKGKSPIATSSSSGSNICKTGNQQMGLKQKGKLVAQDCGIAAKDEEEKLGIEA
ncbi:uncharacterized protein LOC131859911 [Cryptomeria japonica]|uniref:uncharacterized protein LOC131859911 n=1 Tax=Cryptomeria japonica TaxID=3369 RepID=UPI0027DA82A1|nr:uncharacterized protein LOC131859911 [Cryptomeria japonica]